MTFQRDVIDRSHQIPVLVDFWAEWCEPCRVLGPVLERLAARAGGRFVLAKVNTDEEPEVAARYRVSSIPAIKLFHEGAVVAELVGALPEGAMQRWLDTNLPSAAKSALAEAKKALAAKKPDLARRLLEQALESDPDLGEARVLFAELLVRAEPQKAAALLVRLSPNDAASDRAEGVRTLALLVERAQAQAAPPPGAPADAWERYLAGARAFAAGDDAVALMAWIDLVRRRRALDDDGPKRATIALFRLLGEDDEVTQEYRRAFSSALY